MYDYLNYEEEILGQRDHNREQQVTNYLRKVYIMQLSDISLQVTLLLDNAHQDNVNRSKECDVLPT